MSAAATAEPETRADVYLPTPEEIAAACREIRAEWTRAERMSRLNWHRPPLEPEDAEPQEGLTAEAGFGDAARP